LICSNVLAIDSLDVTTGYFWGDLKNKDDYEGVPLMFGMNFDAKPLFEKIGIKTEGELNWIVEPFVNTIIGPNSNVEVGCNFLIKYTFPLTERFRPYLKGGLGALYMSQHTEEQSTQYNFLPQGAAGFQFLLNDKTALNLEYRYRHLSNASFKSPNSGINVDMIMAGFTFFFDGDDK
jgi:opacity protein-like surface antigen